MADVNYAQVGVSEMAEQYNLVQCRVLHADRSYDCTLDSGSCLNLIHWKTVKEFGLAGSLVNASIPFKVADGHVAHTMGELPNVELGFGDCSFRITFSVVDSMDHTILLGTSFMHQAGVVMTFHNREPKVQFSDGKAHRSIIPVTYHRSHQWIKDMESDRRNWPSEAKPQEEGAPLPRVSTTLPHFSLVLEESNPVSAGISHSITTTSTGASSIATAASSSVEVEIDQLALDIDGEGSMPGLFPISADKNLPVVLSTSQAFEADQQDKSDWQILPRVFKPLDLEFGPFTLDACADRAGTNAMVDVWWSSLDDCTKMEWGGHNAWCNPPFHMVEPVLHRFLEC